MITATIAGLTDRLARQAQVLAGAWLAERRATRANDPRRWRDARLLWPDITKD
ncbi:MAG: hypothetical protein AB7G24_09145 [Novosphingobium sp.]